MCRIKPRNKSSCERSVCGSDPAQDERLHRKATPNKTQFSFFPTNHPGPAYVNTGRMNTRTFMKTGLLTLSIGCLDALSTGCVERRVVYVPAYQANPAYTYQPQTAYQPAPAQANPSAPTVAPQAQPQPGTPTDGVVVAQAPPAPQVEVIPVAPGLDYAWMPGYRSIGVGGGWVWAGGHYVIRPRPHAIWVGGGWARHARGYVWVGGHWR